MVSNRRWKLYQLYFLMFEITTAWRTVWDYVFPNYSEGNLNPKYSDAHNITSNDIFQPQNFLCKVNRINDINTCVFTPKIRM